MWAFVGLAARGICSHLRYAEVRSTDPSVLRNEDALKPEQDWVRSSVKLSNECQLATVRVKLNAV